MFAMIRLFCFERTPFPWPTTIFDYDLLGLKGEDTCRKGTKIRFTAGVDRNRVLREKLLRGCNWEISLQL